MLAGRSTISDICRVSLLYHNWLLVCAYRLPFNSFSYQWCKSSSMALMKIDPSDIKLLKIFNAVVDSNGISNAQTVLNKDASTISRAISTLEARLGIILCVRGRQGFELTSEGECVRAEAVHLFSSLRSFENRIEGLGTHGVRKLAIGMIDNIITDANCPVRQVLSRISNFYNDSIHIDLHVKSPAELEKNLLDKQVDVAIGLFERQHDAIVYKSLYEEIDYIYCASSSPVAQHINAGATPESVIHTLQLQNFCSRNFLNESDLRSLQFSVLGSISYTANLEAITMQILSGRYVGFIPEHYARRFVSEGDLMPVLPGLLSRKSKVSAAYRRQEDETREVIRKVLFYLENPEA